MTHQIIDATNLSAEQLVKYTLNFLVHNPHYNWVEGQELFTVCIDNPHAIIFNNDYSMKPYSHEEINIIAGALTAANLYDDAPLHVDDKFCTHKHILDGYKWSLKQQVREQICKYHLSFKCATVPDNEINERTIHSRYHRYTLVVKKINSNYVSLGELVLSGPIATNPRTKISQVQSVIDFIKSIPAIILCNS